MNSSRSVDFASEASAKAALAELRPQKSLANTQQAQPRPWLQCPHFALQALALPQIYAASTRRRNPRTTGLQLPPALALACWGPCGPRPALQHPSRATPQRQGLPLQLHARAGGALGRWALVGATQTLRMRLNALQQHAAREPAARQAAAAAAGPSGVVARPS